MPYSDFYSNHKQSYRDNLYKVGQNLGINPAYIDAIIYLETATTRSPTIPNGLGYYGLLQWGTVAAQDMGYSSGKNLVESNPDYDTQFKLVEKRYSALFKQYGKKNAPGFLYLLNFLPAFAPQYNNKSFVLAESGSTRYNKNPKLDYNKDGKITISDLDDMMNKRAANSPFASNTTTTNLLSNNHYKTPLLIAGGVFATAVLLTLTRKPMPQKPLYPYAPQPILLRGLGEVECNDSTFSKSSGRGTCSRHGGKKGGKDCNSSCFAVWFDVDKIYTDESRFQNRTEKFSHDSVQKLVDSFDDNKLDPITVWKDTNGKVYVLSGHSRLEAHKLLHKKQIPVRFFNGTESEAIRYGKVDANRSGTAETLIEDINAYKLDRDGNVALNVPALNKEGLKMKWKDKANKLDAYSYLNPKGLFIEYMNKPDVKSQFPYIENKAFRVGLWRKSYPLLSNAHEKEIFLYWYSPSGLKLKQEEVEDKISRIISRFDFNPNNPLHLESTGNRGTDGRADTSEAQKRIYEIDKEAETLIKLRRNVITKTEKERINNELQRLQTEKERLENGIKTVLRTQNALFGMGKINILSGLGCNCGCNKCQSLNGLDNILTYRW